MFTILHQHQVAGGGTIITITGSNFPTDVTYVDAGMKLQYTGLVMRNSTNSTFSCAVHNVTMTQVICETTSVSGGKPVSEL